MKDFSFFSLLLKQNIQKLLSDFSDYKLIWCFHESKTLSKLVKKFYSDNNVRSYLDFDDQDLVLTFSRIIDFLSFSKGVILGIAILHNCDESSIRSAIKQQDIAARININSEKLLPLLQNPTAENNVILGAYFAYKKNYEEIKEKIDGFNP